MWCIVDYLNELVLLIIQSAVSENLEHRENWVDWSQKLVSDLVIGHFRNLLRWFLFLKFLERRNVFKDEHVSIWALKQGLWLHVIVNFLARVVYLILLDYSDVSASWTAPSFKIVENAPYVLACESVRLWTAVNAVVAYF